MTKLNGFADGDECHVAYGKVEGGTFLHPVVSVNVHECTVFSAEHGLIKWASGRVTSVYTVEDVFHSRAEALAFIALRLRAVAAAAEAEAAKAAGEAIRLGVGEAVPS